MDLSLHNTMIGIKDNLLNYFTRSNIQHLLSNVVAEIELSLLGSKRLFLNTKRTHVLADAHITHAPWRIRIVQIFSDNMIALLYLAD